MSEQNWIKTFTEKGFAFDRVSTLVITLCLTNGALMAVIIPFIRNYSENLYLHLSLFIALNFCIIIYWYYFRAIFPKGKHKKENLIIAITTEDSKQKTRITKDFANEIKKQLKVNGLDTIYNVIVLNNSLSLKLQNRIQLWNESIQAGLNLSGDIRSFLKTATRLNAKFFVYGDLIKRNEGNSTYFMQIEALIMHAKTNDIASNTLKKEFADLWKREISFLEKDELNGFKSNANHIFLTATYMLGLATLVNHKFEEGIKIWESLERYIKEKGDLDDFKPKISQLKYQSYIMLSRLYHFQGDYVKSTNMREKYLSIIPNEYSALLNEAIKQVTISKSPELALKLIDKAIPLAGKDGTWKYNKFYLLIEINEEIAALSVLDDILSSQFKDEIDIINQVISFNKFCLKENPNHIQSNFIIGVLIYKKLDNVTLAYDYIKSFSDLAGASNRFSILKEKANKYLKEIDKIIGA
ncbi:MAG: hypothetical protein ACX93O_06470 [Flagellimonas sp.]